jgi:hypothetical protein
MKTYGGSGCIDPRSLDLRNQLEVNGQLHDPVLLPPWEGQPPTSIRYIVGSLGPTAGVDAEE